MGLARPLHVMSCLCAVMVHLVRTNSGLGAVATAGAGHP